MDNLLSKITELELKLSTKDTRNNINVINDLLDEDFFEFGVSGTEMQRDEIVEYLLKYGGGQNIKSFDFRGLLIDNNTYILNYKAEQYYEETIYSLRTSIWSKKSGSWKMVFHQATKTTKF